MPTPKAVEVLERLLKGTKIEPSIQTINGKTVKNFKSFKKVLPLSMQQKEVSIVSASGRVVEAPRRRMKLTFMIHEHCPTMPNRGNRDKDDDDDNCDNNRDRHPQIILRQTTTRDEPMDVIDIEMEPPVATTSSGSKCYSFVCNF